MNGKSADEKNRQLWTELYQDSRHHTRYPKEEVVQFVCRSFARDGSCRILDLGCGAGRHVIFMAQENIIPYGLDFSPSGVAHTRNWLEKIGRGGGNTWKIFKLEMRRIFPIKTKCLTD